MQPPSPLGFGFGCLGSTPILAAFDVPPGEESFGLWSHPPPWGQVSHIAISDEGSGSEPVASAAPQPPWGLVSDAQALLLSQRRLLPLLVRSFLARVHTIPFGYGFPHCQF